MDRPNVILLTIDTLRADFLSCYGCDHLSTPNIDRLTKTGIHFSQAITGGSWTQAAFPVLLTSSYPATYGGCLGRLPAERPSPIEALANHGYVTGGFSTNPHLSKSTGYDRGFHHFTDLIPVETDPPLRRIKGGHHLLRSPLVHHALRLFGKNMRPVRVYSSASEVTDEVCSWLDGVSTPFFAWAHYMDVHWPYHLEETLTQPSDIALAWQDLSNMHQLGKGNGESVTPEKRDRFIELYKRSLQYLDAEIGQLLKFLEHSGLDSNTIVILVSDHGEEFFEHGRFGHWESNLYDEILKVPLIIRFPDWTDSQVIENQVRTLDIMPTILDLCDCAVPDGVEGVSITPIWTESDAEYSVSVAISEMQREPWHRISVRTELFKYIWDNRHPNQPELYNLLNDPSEKQNVSDLYPEKTAQFQVHVDTHLRRISETQPINSPDNLEFDDEVIRRLIDLGYVE